MIVRLVSTMLLTLEELLLVPVEPKIALSDERGGPLGDQLAAVDQFWSLPAPLQVRLVVTVTGIVVLALCEALSEAVTGRL